MIIDLNPILTRLAELEAAVERLQAEANTPARLYAQHLVTRYGIAIGTARNWLSAGKVPFRYDLSGKRYCLASELDSFDEWADQQKQRGREVSVEGWEESKKI